MDKSHNPIQYRPDVDGLRAIAILSVIAYHVFPDNFRSGFIGVDIFFIISGYLITSIIIQTLIADRFTLTDFYVRRINRIFPALFTVLLVVFLFGWLTLLPIEFEELGKHIAAGTAFISNIVLFRETGYFNTSAELKPLLHLWSLGIEEQFYFLWPVILAFAWKKKLNITAVLVVLLITSFVINLLRVNLNRDEAFFLLHTRFWELLLGASLAHIEHSRITNSLSKRSREVLSIIGLSLGVLGFLLLDGDKKFPGFWALLPTLSAFLLIATGPETKFNKFVLSNRFMVAVGLISYPLYLWHWPILSFGQIIYGEDFSTSLRVSGMLLALLLSILTYRTLEKPLKSMKVFSRHTLAVISFLSVVLIGGIGYGSYSSVIPPYPSIENASLQKISEALKDWDYPGRLKSSVIQKNVILRRQGDAAETIAFIGDSHIEQLYPRAEILGKAHHKTIAFLTHGSCPPIRGLKDGRHLTETCAQSVDHAFDYANKPEVKSVILGASWVKTFEKNTKFYLSTDPTLSLEMGKQGYQLALGRLKKDIAQLIANNKQVLIIGPTPTGKEFNPKNMLHRSISLSPIRIHAKPLDVKNVRDSHTSIIEALRTLAHETGAEFVYPVDHLCSLTECSVIDESGRPYYKDESHFRPFYATEKVRYFDSAFLRPNNVPVQMRKE